MFKTKHPVPSMVFRLVASDGNKMALSQFGLRYRLNAEGYLGVLEEVKKRILDARAGEEGSFKPQLKFIFQEDGAPSSPPRELRTGWRSNLDQRDIGRRHSILPSLVIAICLTPVCGLSWWRTATTVRTMHWRTSRMPSASPGKPGSLQATSGRHAGHSGHVWKESS